MNRRAFLHVPSSSTVSPVPEAPALAPLPISAGLEPHNVPLDRAATAHLLRRSSFGAAPDKLETYAGKTAADVAAELVQDAADEPLPDPPAWINETPPGRDASERTRQDYQDMNRERLTEWVINWFARMTQYGLREKMTLFWHNHFVTQIEAYRNDAPVAYRYVTTLRTHALGNFKDFVHAVGIDPAMLLYLNGQQNQVGEPNENYARELLELFTMGQFDAQGNQNYTQQDIEQLARALTGWVFNPRDLTATFIPNRHDDGEKTIFGRTGNWGYDDVVDLLFDERAEQIAAVIARKLYREFIYAAPDEALVAELARVFLDNDFEIAPVMRALLSSAHFFDAEVPGGHIKSPVEMLISFLLELDIQPNGELLFLLVRGLERQRLEQAILNPPNVAGWPGHHDWLNTTTFVGRWNYLDAVISQLTRTDRFNFVGLAEKLHDPDDPAAVFRLPVALAEHLFPVAPDLLDVQVSNDPLAGDLDNFPIPEEIANGPAYVVDLAKLFLAGTPWYEWNLYDSGAARQITTYIQTLKLLPEYQLA